MSTELEAPAVQDGAVIHRPVVDRLDKRLWGDGPWQTEPDLLPYEEGGYDCLVMRSTLGNLCGYVAVPAGHPWHDLEPEAVPVRVHGGLEWKMEGNDEWRRASSPDVTWFAFSCSHMGDYFPTDGMIRRLADVDLLTEDLFRPEKNYKTIDYVRADITKIVEAAAAAARRA